MAANALHGENGIARGAKAKADWPSGELSQQCGMPFSLQPDGNGRLGAPLVVAILAKTRGLSFVRRLDWRPMSAVRIRSHGVNRP